MCVCVLAWTCKAFYNYLNFQAKCSQTTYKFYNLIRQQNIFFTPGWNKIDYIVNGYPTVLSGFFESWRLKLRDNSFFFFFNYTIYQSDKLHNILIYSQSSYTFNIKLPYFYWYIS